MKIDSVVRQVPVTSTDTKHGIYELELKATGTQEEIEWFNNLIYKQLDREEKNGPNKKV